MVYLIHKKPVCDGLKEALEPGENTVPSHIAITGEVVTFKSQYLTDGVNHQKASGIYVSSACVNEKRERQRMRRDERDGKEICE